MSCWVIPCYATVSPGRAASSVLRLVLLTLGACTALGVAQAPVSEIAPAWRLQLLPDMTSSCARAYTAKACRGLLFTQDGNLLVYHVSLERPKVGLRGGVDKPLSAFQITLTTYGDQDGAQRNSATWNTESGHGFPTGYLEDEVASAYGGILLRTGSTIHVLANDLTERLMWTLPASEGTGWTEPSMKLSPTRKTVMVTQSRYIYDTLPGGARSIQELYRVCTASGVTLAAGRCTETYVMPVGVTDAASLGVSDGGQLRLAPFSGGAPAALPLPPWANFGGMTDDKHFLYNCCGKSRREREELVLGEVGGDPTSLYKPTSKDEENDSWVRKDQLQVAGGGGLLAWPLARVKRGSSWLDTFDQDKAYRVLIFDLRRHQLLAQTPWVSAPKAQFDYALSPDGEHIAIL